MRNASFHVTRRHFLETAAAAAGAASLPIAPARAAAKYRRYNVTSPEGQKALATYAKGIEAMLKLPPDNPRNWFRHAFIHLMDCPHGNWWFYVWHRGYLGYFERTIRSLTGDDSFAIPYWDWTNLPQIPDGMFDGVLTPTDSAYEPYTGDLARFTAFIQPALMSYWSGLAPAQRAQLNARGYTAFDNMWNDVTGNGDPGNEAFAATERARYLSRSNPKLDEKTATNVKPFIVYSGLLPTDFNNSVVYLSFTSSKTASHNTPPPGADVFSTLEGMPHNKVHNYIGGYGPFDPGPYGNMTNNLSPVDPIFFLHHSNMDRLWDVWTRKQQALKLPYLPPHEDRKTFEDEPFLFFVDGDGNYVTSAKAGDYLSTAVFDYDYQPGFGDAVIPRPGAALAANAKKSAPPTAATVKAGVASVTLSSAAIQSHLAETQPLIAEVTLPRPSGPSAPREFDVLVNAPADVTRVGADSSYYAGTIAFFPAMMAGMKMSTDATFAVPLPRTLHAFTALGAANNATLNIRLAPSHETGGPAPALKAVSVGVL